MAMVRLPRRSLFACLLPLAAALPVHADEADVIHFRASMDVKWDDNLFRAPASSKPQAETIITTIAGVDFNKQVSLQQFIAHVSWVETNYRNNSYLNAGTPQYDGKWLWALGSHLKGELGADRSSIQNSFSDYPGLHQRNLRTAENQRLGLDYAINPSWHAVGSLSHQTVKNDQPLAQENDLEANGATLGLRYTPKSGDWVGFQSRRTDGRYFNRQIDPVSPIDDQFTETGQEFSFGWRPTGHSAVNGRLEFIDRRHPNVPARDFSGWTGQLGYQYQYSAKTLLSATYLRGLNAFQDVNSSYYVSNQLVLGSRWEATGKVAVSTRLGYYHRQYLGELGGATSPQRDDDVLQAGAEVSYQAANWLELKGGLVAEKRQSSVSGLDYTYRQVLLSAIARF